MAVPIQMTQEKRHSPESPSIAVVESELVAEYITTGRCPLKHSIKVGELPFWISWDDCLGENIFFIFLVFSCLFSEQIHNILGIYPVFND